MADLDEATRRQIEMANASKRGNNGQAGSSQKDDDEDENTLNGQDTEDDTEDNEDSDEDSDEDDDWTPPTKSEWENKERALKFAKGDARRLRGEVKTLKAQLANVDKNEDGKAVERARLEGEQTATARYHGIIGRQAAKSALLSAGMRPEVVDKFVRVIELDEVEIDDDGAVEGLEEQVSTLKSEFPMAFTTRNTNGKSRHNDGSGRPPASKKPQSATERQIESALRHRR